MFEVKRNDGVNIPVKVFKFSGGELQVSIDPYSLSFASGVTIRASLTSADDILTLLLLTDVVRRMSVPQDVPIKLVCPYLPYARQDRVMNPGESLALKVMCDLINSQNYVSVEVWDPHSDVATALLDRVTVIKQTAFLQRVDVDKKKTVLVAPDAGAIKKTMDSAKGLGFDMVRADKTRSVNDGSITGTVVYTGDLFVRGNDFLIVDDICDGGRTFIELAKELKKLTDGRILLYVTHGIFSKGLEVFDGLIDHIYCPNIFPNVERNTAILTQTATR